MRFCVCAHIIVLLLRKAQDYKAKKFAMLPGELQRTEKDECMQEHKGREKERKKEREWLDVNRCKHIHTNTQIYDVNTDTKRYTKWSWREPGAPKPLQGDCKGNTKCRTRTLRLERDSIIVSEPAMNKILLISQLILMNSKQFKKSKLLLLFDAKDPQNMIPFLKYEMFILML